MRRTITVMMAILLCLLLTGCVDITAEYGIDKEHNAYIKYTILVDYSQSTAEESYVKLSVNAIRKRFEANGYEASVEYANKKASISLALIQPANSYTEAYEQLKAALTNDSVTPFTSVEMSCFESEYEQSFSFHATLDADKIIATSHFEHFPRDIKEQIEQGIRESVGQIILTLPATEAVEESEAASFNQQGFCTLGTGINFQGPTEIGLVTRLSVEDGEIAGDIEQKIEELEHSRSQNWNGVYIATGVFAACLIAAVVLIIVIARAKRRNT
jgi:hypothetical protein